MSHAHTLLSLLQQVTRVADSAPSADHALRCGAALVCVATGFSGGDPLAVTAGSVAARAAAVGAPAVEERRVDLAEVEFEIAVPLLVRGAATMVLGFRADRRPNLVTLATLGAVGTALGRALERASTGGAASAAA